MNSSLTSRNSYTEALEGLEDETAKAPVYTKRAGVNLLLGRYDAAKSDALASRTSAPADWKAYYNAGRAAYGLCEYALSKSYFEEALKLNAKGAGVQKEYERVLARVKEESEGSYDFSAMHASLSPTSVHIDAGSFLANTRVADSGFHGRGLFATRALKAGDLVYVEKATLMPNQYDPARASAALYTLMVRQLCDNPSLADTVLKLFPGHLPYDPTPTSADTKVGTLVDGVPVVDVFMVEGIRTKNCFSSPLSTYDDTKPTYNSARMAKGLWAHSSLMNHSCVPNTMRSFVGDMLICRATRDISENEELFQQYVPVKTLVDVRNREFEEGWGFECRCGLCEGERKSSEERLKKRKEAMLALEKFLDKKPSGTNGGKGTIIVPDATIRTVDKMMRQLEELHEVEVYGELPRLTLVYPCNWLVDAHRAKKQWGKVVKYSLKVLRNFGFTAVPRDEDPTKLTVEWDPREIYTKSGEVSLMAVHVVASLRRLAEAYKHLGHKELAERCLEAAGFGYTMVTGFSEDVDALGQ